MRYRHLVPGILLVALGLSGCNRQPTSEGPAPAPSPAATAAPAPTNAPTPSVTRIAATPETIQEAEEHLRTAAERARKMRAALTFDEFKATVYREPFAGGKFIVNGDTPISNEKQLREFFDTQVKVKKLPPTELVVAQVSGMDAKWNQQQKRNLTYCVSTTFGPRHDQVVEQMKNATGAWEEVTLVHYVHDTTQDGNCGPTNTSVVFDVRPVDVAGKYLARSFFPNEPREGRNVLIDESSFHLDPGEKLQLVGILRHELGHTIGFRHEHTRPEAGTCFEDQDWRPLTSYDAFSVMHYPQCNGKGDWSLDLTAKDKSGAACLYGPKPPFTIDPSLVTVADCLADVPAPPTPPETQTQSFQTQSVAKGADKAYGPFPVSPGTPLQVEIGGTVASGDPDLYVRFGSKPTTTSYDCRPYTDGPAEACTLTVPANASRVFVMVHGYAAGKYDLSITRVPPSGGGTPPH